MWGPTQNLDPIGSAVLTITNKQTSKVYIDYGYPFRSLRFIKTKQKQKKIQKKASKLR